MMAPPVSCQKDLLHPDIMLVLTVDEEPHLPVDLQCWMEDMDLPKEIHQVLACVGSTATDPSPFTVGLAVQKTENGFSFSLNIFKNNRSTSSPVI